MRLSAWAIAIAAFAAFALGQETTVWSLQTAALRDATAAGDEVTRLSAWALPAYGTAITRAGVAFTRVRVGCFTSRAAAERWGGALARVAPDALPVQIASPPPNVPCTRVDVGFRKPGRFALVTPEGTAPLFEVMVAGRVAWIRYEEGRWQMHPQRPSDLPAAAGTFFQGAVAGQPFVLDGAGRPLCPGRLLRMVGETAIVDDGDAVIACAWGSS